MTTITPEQRQAIMAAGEEPVRVEDPETREVFVVIKEEVYQRLRTLKEAGRIDPSHNESGEFRPEEAYHAIDRAFAEGWNDPKMTEYDEYEKHRSHLS